MLVVHVGGTCWWSMLVVHVGGTRCVTSNTDNNMNIQARITLNVACMRACILICFFFMCKYNDEWDQY